MPFRKNNQQVRHGYGIYFVNNHYCYLSAAKIKNRDCELGLQSILFFNRLAETMESV